MSVPYFRKIGERPLFQAAAEPFAKRGAERSRSSSDTSKPLSANNLALRIASAAVLAPLALVTAYFGGWAFVLFWSAAALAVLWEWMELVAGKAHRPLFISCAGAVVAAGLLVWLDRPISALLMLGLGALAAAQVLLAVMASMYAVYHGPDGLTRIARRVHRLTGISRPQVSRILSGNRWPSLKAARAVAKVLGVSTDSVATALVMLP